MTTAATILDSSDVAEAPSDRTPGKAIAIVLRLRWPAIAIALTLALVGVGVVLMLRTHSLRSAPATANRALSDRDATSEVIGQVSTALSKVLSYQYANPAANKQAAAALLSGDAATQYQTLFTALQKKAPGEKLTLIAKVSIAGVKSLRGNTAELLVFLDQSSTRASDEASSTAAAMLDVTAVRHGSAWKITELRPL
jgi:Mce-associated membrane protein